MIRMMTAALALAMVAGASQAQPTDGPRHERGDWQGRRGDGGGHGSQDQGAQKQAEQPQAAPAQVAPPAPTGGRVGLPGGSRGGEALSQGDGEAPRWSGHRGGGQGPVSSGPAQQVAPKAATAPSGNRNTWNAGRRGGGTWNGDQGRVQSGSQYNSGSRQTWDGHNGYRSGAYSLRSRDRGRSWYDQNRWRSSYHASHRYRIRPYIYPRGWFAQRWSFGQFLPFGWYSSGYYLDWYAFGLPQPPIGCEWVRVGDDALLVDIWSGEVLSVYYDLFW